MSIFINKLTKTFVAPDGTSLPVVDVEHLEILDGEQIALIGSSGSGKTTLLHLIAGILTPESGQILFSAGDGSPETDLAALSEAARDVFRGRNIGYVFQTHHLLPGFTALENVQLGMSFTGRTPDPGWAKHLLTEVGLGERLNYKPGKLSVGQQQRVAVARALANRPRLVLADEPTGALDPNNAQQVLELIRKLCAEVNASLILVTHDLDIAGQMPRQVRLSDVNRAAKPVVAIGGCAMNLFQLVLKQMRQRALSTWLTLLSVLLGVALAVSILILRREAGSLFGQTDYGYDVLIGKQGSALQLVVNTVYHIDTSPGNIPYSLYEKLTHVRDLRGDVRTAVPFAVGDSYKGLPIVGTLPQIVETPVTLVRDAYIGQDDFASEVSTPATDPAQRSVTQKEWHDREQAMIDLLNKAKPGADTYDPKASPLIDAANQQLQRALAAIDQAPFEPATAKAIQDAIPPLKQAAEAMAASLDLPTLIKSTGPLEYRPDKTYQIAEGRGFAYDRFEAVIGSDVSKLAGLKIGDIFQATHGFPRPNEKPDIHKPRWKIVGILKPTHTAADRVLHIPLLSFYTIAEHGVGLVSQNAIRNGQDPNIAVQQLKQQLKDEQTASTQPEKDDDEHENYKLTADGKIQLELPKDVWGLSGIMVKARSAPLAFGLMYIINNGQEASAVNPASVMRGFFENFLNNSAMILLVIAVLVSVVAGVGILVSIYNSVSARMKEIAILRALGATRTKILTLICVEAGLIGLFGGFLGLVVGHLAAAAGSVATEELLGQTINWLSIGKEEWLYLVAVVVVSMLAGLVPAMKAYRVPVATNLVVS